MQRRGCEIIASALVRAGAKTIFTIAGDHTLPLMDHMDDEGFTFIDVRHEQAAVDMASAYGRITGRPGVTLFTTPGHANAIPGLTFALHMENPVVNISGSASQERLGLGAAQEIDQVGMAKPVTKGAWLLSDPRRAPEYIARAFRASLSGRRGPTHLTIPLDAQEAVVDDASLQERALERAWPAAPPQPSPSDVDAALEILRAAERPLIIAGNGAYNLRQNDIEKLAETTGIPVFTEESARGVIPDAHPLCGGCADARGVNDAAQLISEADALLLLGKKLDFTISFGGAPSISEDARIIQVEADWEQIATARDVDLAIAADPGSAVRLLADAAGSRAWASHPMSAEIKSARAKQVADLDLRAAADSPLHAMHVHAAVKDIVDDDVCLVFEGADFGFYGASYHPANRLHRWMTNGTLGMLGWGVPYGIGAQVALPNSRVVVFTGDGGFGFNGFEIDTAVRHNLPVVVIVGNDRVWGIDYHQQAQIYGKTVATTLLPTRYDKIAEGMGAHAEIATTQEELIPALTRAFDAKGPAVVNALIEPSPSPLTEWVIRTKSGERG